jgi:NIMA (never in mitosis gene a)-related kinase
MTTLKPPFRAQDMNGLYKRVLQGKYPPISHKFSKDLAGVIAKLLTVEAKDRPSLKEVLKMPVIQKKCKELERTTEHFDADDAFAPEAKGGEISEDPLLKTIRVPQNLVNLTGRLPKSNYSKLRGSEDPRSKTRFQTGDSDKRQQIQTLKSVKNRAESMLPAQTDS